MRNGAERMAVAVVVALLACGGGSGSSGSGSGTHLTATEDTWGTVTLAWDLGAAQGFTVEGRIAGGSWQALGNVPADSVGATISLNDALPELTQLEFQVCPVGGGPRGGCAETGLLHGVHPAGAIAAASAALSPYSAAGPITVTWSNASAVATDLVLERRPAAGDPPWTVLSTDFTLTSFVDTTAQEGVAYVYRVRYGAQGVLSLPVVSASAKLDVWIPEDVRIDGIAGGYRVSWLNRSTSASALTLGRSSRCASLGSPDHVFDLPPDADHYDDLTATPFLPTVRYGLVITIHGVTYPAAGGAQQLIPSVHVPGPVPLTGVAREMPLASYVARDAAGGFHLAGEAGGSTALWRWTGSGWDQHVLAGMPVAPGIALDAQGHPHTVMLGSDGSIQHTWYDGSAWHDDGLPAGTCSVLKSPRFDVDDAGRLGLLCSANGALVYTPWNGAWGAPEALPLDTTTPRLAVTRDGVAYVVAVTSDQIGPQDPPNTTVYVRSRAGAWTSWTAKLPGDSRNVLVAGDAGRAGLVHFSLDSQFVYHLGYTPLSSQGPGTTEPVMTLGSDSILAAPAMSRDGTRVAFLTRSDDGAWLELHTRDSSGWTSEVVGPNPYGTASNLYDPAVVGFGPDGKLWLTANLALGCGSPDPSGDFGVWTED